MPSAVSYIPPTDTRRNGYNSLVWSERHKRETAYRKALDYYLGKHPLTFELDSETGVDDNTIINLVKLTADRTVEFLFHDVPEIKTSTSSAETNSVDMTIKAFFEANGGLPFLVRWALRGFLAGHTFIRVRPPTTPNGLPKMVLLDPLAVTVFWRADDVSDVLWYENRYFVGQTPYIEDYVLQPDGTCVIYTYEGTKRGEGESFQTPTPVASDKLYSYYTAQGVTYKLISSAVQAMCPIVETAHLPHPDDYYGLHEVDQLSLQDTINKLASEIQRISRINSDPKDYIIGAEVADVENEGNLFTIPNPAAKIGRLEMRGELASINDTLNQRIEMYLAVVRVVLLRGEAKDLQRVTNTSVRTLFIDMLAKTNLLQQTYGRSLKKLCLLALRMMGDSRPYDFNIKFSNALPVDMTEVANVNAILVGLGVRSRETAAKVGGDNWAFEKAKIEEEAKWRATLPSSEVIEDKGTSLASESSETT